MESEKTISKIMSTALKIWGFFSLICVADAADAGRWGFSAFWLFSLGCTILAYRLLEKKGIIIKIEEDEQDDVL